MNVITVEMIDAIKVQFLKQIFEDDFPERGMKAWLTKIEWSEQTKCYKLYFDFTEFESENNKYFSETYYPNNKTKQLGVDKQFYTAIEAGCYTPKYSVYFSVDCDLRNDAQFNNEILQYLRVVN